MTVFSWIQRRDRGFRPKIGERDSINRSIYTSIMPYGIFWSPPNIPSEYGGVYNLEFSPDGSLMVAACEKRCIVLYDPISNRKTKAIKNAHQDCVNCVKFLDDRMFATCSDDTTVALWDTRNLKNKIRSLHGHLNWVKNIEYSRKDALLVTSGFDGSIFTWDINSYTEQGFVYQKVFHTPGLMRCRISPDATKLVICTTGGYLIIIHNLDLSTLANDLSGFRPNIYRLMQMGRQLIPYAAKFDHVFSNEMKKNRVELVSDFPLENDAEVISSLQIHPEGWCALSRNISFDESSEWSCVHDIQEYKTSEDDDCTEEQNQRTKLKAKKPRSTRHSRHNSINDNRNDSRSISDIRSIASNHTINESNSNHTLDLQQQRSPTEMLITTHPDIWAAEVTVRDRMLSNQRRHSAGTFGGNTHVYGISSGVLPHPTSTATITPPPPPPPLTSSRLTDSNNSSNSSGINTTTTTTTAIESVNSVVHSFTSPLPNIASYTPSHSQCERTINENVRRMLYYVEEPNHGKGFIKELCFSSDGRIICSPYGNGFRLLAFSKTCAELPNALNPYDEACPLVELKYIKCHPDLVVSTKFSPRQPLLASGCLKGKVMWHQSEF